MSLKKRLNIVGMHCSNCALTIEEHFKKLEHISVSILLGENVGIFDYDEEFWNEDKIAKELRKIGYNVQKDTKIDKELIKLILSIIFTLPLLLTMLMHFHVKLPAFLTNGYLQWALASIVLLIAGIPFFKGLVRDVKNKRLGMDVLISLGTSISYLFSIYLLFKNGPHTHLYFETTALILTLILTGKYLEGLAKRKTSSSLKALMDLISKETNVIENDNIVVKSIEEVKVNDLVLIKNGERISVDGVIVSGSASIDESMISGESLPVYKTENDKVIGGTICVDGSLTIKVSKESKDSYLAYIIKSVEEIQKEKPHIQKIADKIASIFVPSVLLISLLCFLITLFIKDFDLSLSLERAISVLVISCPCSLGLATPLSIMVASSRAAKLGIIYKNGDIFERIKKIDAICFDKTGTLSEGKFAIKDYQMDKKYFDILYTLERISSHPIAKCLVDFALTNDASVALDLNPKEIIGKGIEANDYKIGNPQVLGVSSDFIKKYQENGYSVIVLVYKEQIIGQFAIEDKIKEETKEVIKDLKEKNIQVYMLTGDSKVIASRVANEIGIDSECVFSEVKPEDKSKIINSIKEKGKNIAFVGDGINDALALNSASLAIAMGSGSDIAISSSDITLSNNKISLISSSLNLSYKTLKNIKENFIWAFSYNIIAIPLAFFGVLTPVISGLCMSFSNIMVVLNALRLYKVKI